MARKFGPGSDFAQTANTVNLTGVTKLTLSLWLYKTLYGTGDNQLVYESSANFNSNNGGVIFAPDQPSNLISIGISAGNNADYNSITVPQPSSAAWHHFFITLDIGKWAASVPCAVTGVWIDGISQTLTAGTLTANTATDFGNYTWNIASRGGSTLFLDGRLRDFFIWQNINLSGGRAASIASGQVDPADVSRDNLIAGWRFDARNDTLANNVAPRQATNLELTYGGGSVTTPDPPRLSYPVDSKRRFWTAGGTVAVGAPLINMRCHP